MSEPTYQLTPDAVVWATEDGETLALNLEAGSYHGVNNSGTLLWGALVAGATRSELVSRLRTEFDLDAERATADVTAFLDACQGRGFLAH